ncbi:SdpI family protein [Turicibacter sanguinis]|uniref:SdpI family protein n=1 Tax=Turicibacter sanguinis TaxID=154288 RepID=UPI001E5EB64F|nr:SdpI family protein [Turicibacter sanguinis]MDB8563457.1 SdpI family protein [Turicibacter sanguinis]
MLEFSVFIVGLLSMLIGVVNVLESDQDIRRFGYRVRSVLQTKESWQFANKVFGVMLVSMGQLLL